ncbi:MAG: hypothetical protein IJZ85_03520 [Lachnospiraceae bacterium]|nr:hypothetical protein [Lachnospiraceae bacterium]
MADFTRFISYLYDYRGGERNRNLGFAKVESRQGMCRLTVCLNHGQVLQQKMALCGYIAGEGVSLVHLGEMEKGARERQWRFPAGNLGGCGVAPEQLSGLILLSEDRRAFLLSVWNDGNLTAEDIRLGAFWEKAQASGLAKQDEAVSGAEEEVKSQEVNEGQTVNAGRRPDNAQEDQKLRVESGDGKEIARESADETDYHTRYQIDRDNDEIAMENASSKTITVPIAPGAAMPADCGTSAPEPWLTLCRLFPAAKPFEPSAWEVLCISLQDIGRLPPENWVWGNNHFVLHGFYQYRHLILARQRVENRIYLGVPGEFGVNEKFMAAMFGLHRFERERKGKSEMGYWLAPVNLNQL